jgi:hypothetical protein
MSLVKLGGLGAKAAKKTAPFYSAVDEALGNLKRPKGTGIEFLTEVLKQPGVKKAEIADRKLEQAFKAKGKMTKEEAQQVLADNPPPQVKEKVYDDKTAIDEDDLREMVSQEMFGVPYSTIGFSGARHRQISDEVYRRMDADNGTVYGRYRTPNGENYREILLKLPVQGDDAKRLNEISMTLHGVPYTSLTGDTSEMAKLRLAVKREYKYLYGESGALAEDRAMYRSNHWKEDPNVLAHMRVQDRIGPNGEKILHVEEIQSDWHQTGRVKGYKPADYVEQSNALEKEFKDLVNKRGELRREAERIGYRGEGHRALVDEANSITPRLMQLQEQRDNMQNVINYGVADAPFKKSWHELAMKRLLNYAADNGYDSIAITPGAEQAKRYDLSKQLSEVVFDPATGYLSGRDPKGNMVVAQQGVTKETLPDYIGKEGAQKILEASPDDSGNLALRGVDLQVGGEGMKGFYDQILPNYLNTFGKPYGAQVGQIQAPIKHELEGLRRMAGMAEEPPLTLHNFPITPEMRESIKQKGLPLYQQVGIPTAGAGAASQMLESQEEPEYSKGGSIAKMAALAKMKKMKEEMAPRAEAVKNLIARDQNRYLADVVPNSLTNAEIKAEIERMAARARASGQQEGVLPRAERDANLAKMLEQSAIQDRLYHGTTDDVPRFDPNMAGKKTGNLTTALGTFLSDNPAESSRYAELWGTEGGNVMPVFAQLKNPYVMPYSEYNNLAMGAWNRRMKDPDYDPNQIIKFGDIEAQKRASEALKKHEAEGLQDVIKKRNELIEKGHDSIVINIGGNREIIVFDPNKIKSAIGNRGTYDINEPEVNKATGGAIAKMARKAAPAPKAPMIMKPSALTELRKTVQQEKGDYGSRRLERAADEIPNLEKMYQEKALREAFTGDNAKALMTMNPADFEKYAAKLFTLEPSGSPMQGSSDDYLNYLRKLPEGFRDVPFLEINKREQGAPMIPFISGHEGRHRSRALTKNEEPLSLVRLMPRSEMREPFPRRSQQEYIEALKEELALTGNKVKPENYTNLDSIKVITRPPIDLPDIYAKGGAVKPKVKDAKSGKVTMTKNRDTMFMELSNKKLKRK